jgi:hypothetical protein
MRTFNIPKIEAKPVKFETQKSEQFITNVIGEVKRIHFNSGKGIVLPERELFFGKGYLEQFSDEKRAEVVAEAKNDFAKPTSTVSNFVMALHSAFDKHIPFSLSPEVVMMIISQEVAQYIKDHSSEADVASLVTKTPNEKQQINVSVDHFVYENENPWLEGIVQFRDKLAECVPSATLEYMLPKFSNGSLETEVAHLVSFMDAASNHYEYSMSTCCGIPSFRLEGTADDWDSVIRSATKLEELLPGLNLYFTNLIPVLNEICNTSDGNKVDNDFWSSMYKQQGGSGGPYSNGWFNNLYAYRHSSEWRTGKHVVELKESGHYNKGFFVHTKLTNFPSNLSVVPFTWDYYETKIPMSFIAGVCSVELNDGFLTPKLGVMVAENNT